MIKINKKIKRREYIDIVAGTIGIVLISTIIAFFIHGFKLFSSFSFYIEYAGLGFAYGFAFGIGHKLISIFINKLNWSKDLKKANMVGISIYIIFGILVSILVPFIWDYFLWGMKGESLFIDVSIKALMVISVDMIFISIYYSTYLTKYWKKTIEKNEELKRENLIAKYEALKNKVNPHFLFNSLNTLSGIVEKKTDLATDFIKKLSNMYRYILEKSDKEVVPLLDEIELVDDFIFLSKIRFGEALIFNSSLINDDDYFVVPLGLQMLVENAIKHNVVSDDKPLKIEISIYKGFIIVRNNIQKKTIIENKEPLGLENLRKRYSYLSDLNMETIISDEEFIVKLPIIKTH